MAQFFPRALVALVLVPTSATGLPEICRPGVYDCNYGSRDAAVGCAPYDGEYADPRGNPTLLVMGCIVAAVLAFGIGGNDSASSWGTSVGSGAISLRNACLLGGLGELLGAALLGTGVSSTIHDGVAPLDDPQCWACGYCDSRMAMYEFGMMSASAGAAVFLLLVTGFSIPISSSHAILGGVVGMTLVGTEGDSCLNWSGPGAGRGGLLAIAASSAAAPILSGLCAVLARFVLERAVLRARDPAIAALRSVPVLLGLMSAVMTFLMFIKSPSTKNSLPGVAKYSISAAVLFLVLLLVQFLLVPRIQRQVLATSVASQAHATTDVGVAGDTEVAAEEVLMKRRGQAQEVFRMPVVFVAFLESFAHGAIDTANATGPLGAIVNTYKNGVLACSGGNTPWWIMTVAGLFVALGVNVTGHRVIKTVGEEIIGLDFVIAFCVEFASSLSAVLATFIGIPASTTQYQVVALIFLGAAGSGLKEVPWGLFSKIILTWLLSVPFSAGLAAQLMWLRFHAF